jgi:hypothetical protein
MKRIAKPVIVAALLASAMALPASAETCRDRFVRLLVEGNGDGAVKIHVTQEIKGAPSSQNWFYQQEPGHWMTEVIEPAGQPWVLTHNDVMYTSADKGESWTKLRDFDSDPDAARAQMEESAQTAKNEVCGNEELDGVMFDTVEADYVSLQGFKSENHHKYWVHPDTGFIAKAVYHLKSENFESTTTQLIEAAPDLKLPTP